MAVDPEAMMLTQLGWSNPRLPVLIYRGVFPVADVDAIEAVLAGNDWRPDWRNGVYPFHHYHSTAHEALACVAGSATLTLGGKAGRDVTIAAGDLLVLPAGTGHRHVEASGNFLLVGAYPDSQDWDVCRQAADEEVTARIAAVPLPTADPIAGRDGPINELWKVTG